jgi:hypothetical protein
VTLIPLLMLLAQVDAPYIRSVTGHPNAAGNEACLHWRPGQLVMRQNNQGNPAVVPAGSEFAAVSRAIGHWTSAFDTCANLTVVEGDRTDSRRIGYRSGTTDNENVLLFRMRQCVDVVSPSDQCWSTGSCGNAFDCWEHSPGTIALTTTSYDPESGALFDADVEADAAAFFFTTVDSPPCTPTDVRSDCVGFDVENTFTHEMGHVVGLAHTNAPGSTMNPSAPVGETSKRQIDPGTLSFVCVAYPAGQPSDDCLPLPPTVTASSLNCAATAAAPSGWLFVMLWFAALCLPRMKRPTRATFRNF